MTGIVVDENVIREAVEGKKPDGSYAHAVAEFMHKLFRSTNKIFVNVKIESKYRALQKKIDRDSHNVHRNDLIYAVLADMLNSKTRVDWREGVRVTIGGLKECDREFAGVALQTKSVLVTSDDRLRGILEREMAGQGVECHTPADAIDLLRVEGQ